MDPLQLLRYYRGAVEESGSPSITHMMGRPVMLVARPEHVKDVVGRLKEKTNSSRRIVGPMIGQESIILRMHSRWGPLRRSLAQVFTLTSMRGYFGVFVDSTRDFVARIEEHNSKRKRHFEEAHNKGLRTLPTTLLEPLDVDGCSMDLALDVVTRALFSRDLAIQRGNAKDFSVRLASVTDTFFKAVLNPVFWLVHPFQYFAFKRNLRWFQSLLRGWIQERQAVDPTGSGNKDLLGLMLGVSDPETGNPLTTEEILAQAFTFYFAGHDTSAHTIAWALYEIAQHPEVEAKLYEELVEVMGDKDTPTFEEASKLTYLQWVIKETLRLHAPAGSFSRETTEETEVAGVLVPAHTTVTISVLAAHGSEITWPEPWRFRPERFSEKESAGRDPYAWIPFSMGEKNCIGMNFALLEIRTVVAILCKRYRVAPSVDLLPHTATKITNAPVDGIYVHFLPRKQ